MSDGTGRIALAMSATDTMSVEQTEALLRDFARRCALSVAHLWEMPDYVRQYLETGDESMRLAAASVTWWTADSAAERDATRSAAVAAMECAWSAAEFAAQAAAWECVRGYSPRGVCEEDAWSAAFHDAWNAILRKFGEMALEKLQRDFR